ncbi:MAG: hypothetical protein HY318_18240 [Armatimonadetes bacterium]|nr:hypothetical protein [Armatimonadota bacterium]
MIWMGEFGRTPIDSQTIDRPVTVVDKSGKVIEELYACESRRQELSLTQGYCFP